MLILIPSLLAGGIIFTPAFPESLVIPWLILCFAMLVLAMYNAATRRPCGHGYVIQGKHGFAWPKVVGICPTCGERFD